MKTSPTQRTLAECRKRGWTAAVTERWNPHAGIRQDLFGWCDVVALDTEGRRIIGIQACAAASHAARRAKAEALPGLAAWLEAGGVAYVWSWAKQGPRGRRKLWTLREERITAPLVPVGDALPATLRPATLGGGVVLEGEAHVSDFEAKCMQKLLERHRTHDLAARPGGEPDQDRPAAGEPRHGPPKPRDGQPKRPGRAGPPLVAVVGV